jgi:chromosome segregation ATPase
MTAKYYLTKNKKKKSKKKTKKYSRKGASAKQGNDRFYKEITELNFDLEKLIAQRKEYADGMATILMAKRELDKRIESLENEILSIVEVGKTITDDSDDSDEDVDKLIKELNNNYELKNSELLDLKSDKEKIDYTIYSFDLVLRELTSDINDIRDQIKHYKDYSELVFM